MVLWIPRINFSFEPLSSSYDNWFQSLNMIFLKKPITQCQLSYNSLQIPIQKLKCE